MSISSNVTSDKEITKRAIEANETTQMHYVIFISPMSGKAMYTAKMDGDFTITDPRCCMNPDGSPDIVCSLWVHVSELYFDAMVKSGYITNNLRVILHCTIHDTYTYKLAVNTKIDKEILVDPYNAREIQDRIKSKSGLQSPDILTRNYTFKPLDTPKKKNGMQSNMGYMEDTFNNYRTKVLTSAQFRGLSKAMLPQYMCDLQLDNEKKTFGIINSTRFTQKLDKCKEANRISAIPTLIIEGDWNLKADFPNQPFFGGLVSP